jgi:hypothetical protein
MQIAEKEGFDVFSSQLCCFMSFDYVVFGKEG